MIVTEIQRFCMHDGPGLRTTVFMKGCPLNCAWCHNPEGQKPSPQLLFYQKKCVSCGACGICHEGAHSFYSGHLFDRSRCSLCFECAAVCPSKALQMCGKEYTVSDILDAVERDKAFYGCEGGITLSGGEPFSQPDEAIALIRECKKRSLNTVAETCGFFSSEILPEIVSNCDLLLWDIKDTDSARHMEYTGVAFEPILRNLESADRLGAHTRLRCILVNGVNTDDNHYRRVAEIASSLRNCEGVELIPYHAYGAAKAAFLGDFGCDRKDWIPSKSEISYAGRAIASHGVRAINRNA